MSVGAGRVETVVARSAVREDKQGVRRRQSALGRLRRAWYRMRSPWALLQALLAGGAVSFAVLWLELPDSAEGEQVVAGLLLLVGVAVGAWAEAAILIASRRAKTRRPVWRGASWLVGMLLVYGMGVLFLQAGSLQDGARAVFLEQRTPLWHLGGGDARLLAMEGVGWTILRWVLAGALWPLLLEGVAVGHAGLRWRGWTAPLRHWLYWAVGTGVVVVGGAVTEGALGYRPEVASGVQIFLSVAKAAVVAVGVVGGFCLMVALTGTYLRDAERESSSLEEAGRAAAGVRRTETA